MSKGSKQRPGEGYQDNFSRIFGEKKREPAAPAGPFYFLLTEGEYSDYRVAALYVCDHLVTEEDWTAFEGAENALRRSKYDDVVTQETPRNVVLGSDDLRAQRKQYEQWARERGTPAELFIAKHGMRKVEQVELLDRGYY